MEHDEQIMKGPRRTATGLIETVPAVVTEVTLRMSLEQYRALREVVTGYGPMEGAWNAFRDVDRALCAVGVSPR